MLSTSPEGHRCSHPLPGLIGSATWQLALILFLEKEAEAQREVITQPGSHGWCRAGAGFMYENTLLSTHPLGQALEKQQ